ncbi:hypothetical protein UFOVP760_16 [uncultured Caudovirales phage]|uniref:Uncharacterized protein n=1 Tax=uncultured Caudovirales phage TaxID=2100421 RepID=A0A6J7X8M5_9CAUD|nr:hypothetical protein UFOVP760_16 [uncultured Caudovirales phage]
MKREDIKDFLKEVLTGLEEHDELSVIRNKVVFAAMEFGSMLVKDVHPSEPVIQEVILPAIKKFEERVNEAFNLK